MTCGFFILAVCNRKGQSFDRHFDAEVTQRPVHCVTAGKETVFPRDNTFYDRHFVTGLNCPSQRDERLVKSLVTVRLTNGPFHIPSKEHCIPSIIACENIRFPSFFADGDVSRAPSSRNVPSGEERGETDVFAGYFY